MGTKKLPDKRLTAYRQRLVADNLRLVHWHVARRMRGFPQELQDEAADSCMLGLVRAAQLYDRRKKAARTGKPCRFGTYAMHWIKSFFQRWVDGCTRERRLGIIQMSAIGKDVPDGRPDWEPADHRATEEPGAETREELFRLLRCLPQRQALVLRLRYLERMTLAEVGERLGITRERVRQLEQRAKARLRREAS